ncbi:YqcC family protein [Marinobacter daepoensis]|uniref:YqcC family protein n=1 Tax=Marinobacter daepoensis TaxID=262077 RepID=A0ABS3BIQ1_9GAMM|nr:YqcC family protein [Marinobacter daepoensis]MBN7771713.1 YqcC family protein [Marinobacter daepoensis]MBY6034878.1 YqcC family protein [Marinobacter daepoensis]MBY6080891.1 YqcC family protein [Marinobacter daepoensis]
MVSRLSWSLWPIEGACWVSEKAKQLDQVTDGLLRIEIELRQLGVWELEPPPSEAFRSTQPFCLDTMEFTQWLQFVFLDRMKVLVERGHPLPAVSGIAPMAEEHFRGREKSGQSLVRALEEMDRLLSAKGR